MAGAASSGSIVVTEILRVLFLTTTGSEMGSVVSSSLAPVPRVWRLLVVLIFAGVSFGLMMPYFLVLVLALSRWPG
jgi:uncharacterized membrane protein YjgN (DUF898 family)